MTGICKIYAKLLVCAAFIVSGISNCAVGVHASDLSDDELLGKYSDQFFVIEKPVPPDSDMLSNPMYMRKSVYADGILYSAYDNNVWEYDWTQYVELVYDIEPPSLRREYHNCEQENGFYYSVHNHTATVHGVDVSAFADAEMIAIPDTLGGFTVREIAPHAFDGSDGTISSNLVEISIPDSVEVICSYAFYAVFSQERNASLSVRQRQCKINMPASVKYIGHYAFGYGTVCAFGDTVVLPETLEFIDHCALWDNSVHMDLKPDPQHLYEGAEELSSRRPYLYTDNGYVPVSSDFYPSIELPNTQFVCNREYIAMQSGFFAECHALGQLNYAEYYVRENLSYAKGDFNNDGTKNVADVVCLERYLQNALDEIPSKWQSGDMNGDGKLNAVDLTLMKRDMLYQPWKSVA